MRPLVVEVDGPSSDPTSVSLLNKVILSLVLLLWNQGMNPKLLCWTHKYSVIWSDLATPPMSWTSNCLKAIHTRTDRATGQRISCRTRSCLSSAFAPSDRIWLLLCLIWVCADFCSHERCFYGWHTCACTDLCQSECSIFCSQRDELMW